MKIPNLYNKALNERNLNEKRGNNMTLLAKIYEGIVYEGLLEACPFCFEDCESVQNKYHNNAAKAVKEYALEKWECELNHSEVRKIVYAVLLKQELKDSEELIYN